MQNKHYILSHGRWFWMGVFAFTVGIVHGQAPKLPETLDEKLDALAEVATDGFDVKTDVARLGAEAVPTVTRKLLESLAEGSSPSGAELSAIIDMPREDQQRANHQMGLVAIQCIALQTMTLDADTKQAAQQSIYGVLRSPYMIARKAAIYAAADSGGKDAADEIVPMLNDSDMSNRVNAAQMLAKIGDESTADKIAAILEQRRNGLTSDQIERDWSFRHGYSAIEMLRGKSTKPTETTVQQATQNKSPLPPHDAPIVEKRTLLPWPLLVLGVLGLVIAAAFLLLFICKNLES